MDASEIYLWWFDAKEVLISQKWEELTFPIVRWYSKIVGEKTTNSREPTPRREQTVRSEGLSGELRAEPDGPQPAYSNDDGESWKDYCCVQGDLIHRHHNEPRVHSMCRTKKHSIFHWNRSMLRESLTQIWIGCKKSELMTAEMSMKIHMFVGFLERNHNIYSIEGDTSKRIYVVRRRLTTIQTTTRPDNVWPEAWTQIWKAAQITRKSKKWALERPKLDNARRLRGINSIDLEECQDFFEEMRRESSIGTWTQLCHARRRRGVYPALRATRARLEASNKVPKTKYTCMMEAHEPTRQRVEPSVPKNLEDHIAGKGHNSMTHHNLVHKFMFRCLKRRKSRMQKAAVDKEWKKLETTPAWQFDKVRSKKEVILKAQDDKKKVHFASLMDICYLENAELEPKFQTYKGRVVLRGDIVKDDSGAYAVFTAQGSSPSQMTAAKVMDVTSRLPDCDGRAADAVSAYTQVKLEDAPKLLKIPKAACPDIWIRLPRHKWPKSWADIVDPVAPLEGNLYGHPVAGLLWERQFEEVLLELGLECPELGMSMC